MLPIILVLLAATSTLADPGTVNLIQISENDIRFRDNSLFEYARKVLDDGEINVNVLTVKEAIKDLSRILSGQALAFGQAIALLGELSTGRPGDACVSAKLVNEYVRYAESGKKAGIRQALRDYVQYQARSIDSIVRLVTYPEAARYASGFRGGCAGEGKSYQINEAWEYIIGNTPRDQSRIMKEEYCTVKRLYSAINSSNNNVGAVITASALPPTIQLYNACDRALGNFLYKLASKENVASAAKAAKQALYDAIPRIILN